MSTLAVDSITDAVGSGAPAFPNGVSGNIVSTGALTATGIYLGGTGSANLLDDYEEGYHLTSITCGSSGSITLSATQRYLSYTKIGNRVFVSGKIDIASISSPIGYMAVSLPFSIDSTSVPSGNDSRRFAGTIWVTGASGIDTTHFALYGIEGESIVRIYNANGTSIATNSANAMTAVGNGMNLNFNYRTA